MGSLRPKVIEYLSRKIKAQSFCEIEPIDFFSFGGAAIENDTGQLPECRFYSYTSGLVPLAGIPPYRYNFAASGLALPQKLYQPGVPK